MTKQTDLEERVERIEQILEALLTQLYVDRQYGAANALATALNGECLLLTRN